MLRTSGRNWSQILRSQTSRNDYKRKIKYTVLVYWKKKNYAILLSLFKKHEVNSILIKS